jgi:hypothetical protein
VKDKLPPLPCSRRTGDCLRDLAAGYVAVDELCAGCTRKVMVALEWVGGDEFRWSAGMVARARGETEPAHAPAGGDSHA